jgi:diacylglycerol kinase
MQDKEFPTPGKSTAYHQLPKKVVQYDSLKSVFYAIQGISFVVRREPNLTIQFCVGVVMAALAGYNGRWITAMGNLILMSIVMSLEIVNSVIETLCDLIESQNKTHQGYGRWKCIDCSSRMVSGNCLSDHDYLYFQKPKYYLTVAGHITHFAPYLTFVFFCRYHNSVYLSDYVCIT